MAADFEETKAYKVQLEGELRQKEIQLALAHQECDTMHARLLQLLESPETVAKSLAATHSNFTHVASQREKVLESKNEALRRANLTLER